MASSEEHDWLAEKSMGTKAVVAEKKKRGMSRMLLLTTVSVAFGCALPAGYTLSSLNAPQSIIEAFCMETVEMRYGHRMTPNELNVVWSLVVSLFVVGGMVGAGFSGYLCNLMGRKGALLFNQLFGITGGVLLVSAQAAASVEVLILGRILVGFHSGFTCSAAPIYLTEISPIHLRGLLGVIQPAGFTFGILIAQVLGLKFILGTPQAWPFLLGFVCIPIVIFSVVLYICPESPKYLYIVREKQDAALAELSRLHGLPCTELQEYVQELREAVKLSQAETPWSLRKLLMAGELRMPILLMLALQFGQQLVGINAIFYYSTSIFISSGISEEHSQFAGIGAGVINAGMAGVAMILVSKFGRRPLALVSISATVISLVVLTVALALQRELQWMSYVAVVALLSFVLAFGAGLGPIPYFIGSELFQQGPKPAAMSLGCWAQWTGNFIVGMSFPSLQGAIAEYCFLLFAAFGTMLFVFIYKCLPETKDEDPDDVARLFRRQYEAKLLAKGIITPEELPMV